MRRDAAALIDSLEDLLDRERVLLLSGSLDGVARIAEEKEGLLGHLAGANRPADLARIRSKADRNAALLLSAGAGLKSVSARLAQLAAGPPNLSTYRADGRREDVGRAIPRIEKRA